MKTGVKPKTLAIVVMRNEAMWNEDCKKKKNGLAG